MTDEQIDALLDEFPGVRDPALRARAKMIAGQKAEQAAADARWERIEAHAGRFVAAAIFRGELYLSVPANTVAIGQAIALAEVFVGAIDRRREEQT